MRNIWCPKYNQCLTQAAVNNEDGFSCDGCPMAENQKEWFGDPAEAREESLKCARLLFRISPRMAERFAYLN